MLMTPVSLPMARPAVHNYSTKVGLAKVPKCYSLAIQASTAQQFDSKLYLNDQSIPFIWNHTIKFLGGPIQVLMTNQDHKQHLKEKLAQLLNKVGQVPVTRKQKLLLYKAGICPCLNWDLSILELPISWIHSTLDATTTCFLKKWSSLADPACLYLPKGDGGLALPPISLLYKKLKASQATLMLTSRDPETQLVVGRELKKKKGNRERNSTQYN